jgi:hypothetical protein
LLQALRLLQTSVKRHFVAAHRLAPVGAHVPAVSLLAFVDGLVIALLRRRGSAIGRGRRWGRTGGQEKKRKSTAHLLGVGSERLPTCFVPVLGSVGSHLCPGWSLFRLQATPAGADGITFLHSSFCMTLPRKRGEYSARIGHKVGTESSPGHWQFKSAGRSHLARTERRAARAVTAPSPRTNK